MFCFCTTLQKALITIPVITGGRKGKGGGISFALITQGQGPQGGVDDEDSKCRANMQHDQLSVQISQKFSLRGILEADSAK